MAFIKHLSGRTNRGPRTSLGQIEQVSMSVVMNGGKKQQIRSPAIQIRIYKDLIKTLGWIAGDRVDLFIDDEYPAIMMLQRSPTGEFALSSTNGKADIGKNNVSCNVKCKAPKSLDAKVGTKFFANDFEIKNGSLIVVFEPIPQ